MSQSRRYKGRSKSGYQLPTARTRVVDQLRIVVAAGRHRGAFTSQQLCVPGVTPHRTGLVTSFLRACGLLKREGHGVFRATSAARAVAEAWDRSESLGRRELAAVLEATWFAECARQELEKRGKDGAPHAALAELLRISAGAPVTRRREAQMLVSWLLEAGLLRSQREGHLGWNARAEAEQKASGRRPDEGAEGGGSSPADAERPSAAARRAVPSSNPIPLQTVHSSGIRDRMRSGAGEFYLHEFLQLSEKELLRWYRGQRGQADCHAGVR